MKTINGVPDSLTVDEYTSLIASVGFDEPKNLRRLEFRMDGIYAEVYERDERGRIRIDTQKDEAVINRVFIPVRK